MSVRIASIIDHSLLHPTLTNQELLDGCAVARAHGVASVCVKPCDVVAAVEPLAGCMVAVGTVVGFPHGATTTDAKVFEARLACEQGATELDMVVNIGKVLGLDWAYVEAEVRAVVKVARAHGALTKVIFENDFLPQDGYKIRLCEICRTCEADFAKTSTGFGFVKQPDGHYDYQGATEDDVRLMVEHSGPNVQVKAAGGIRSYVGAARMRDLGVTRIGATATENIVAEERASLREINE